MEDVTDISFRLVCKELGADIVYTEFVNSEGLIRDSKKAHRKMEFSEMERPFGIQIYGGEESSMESATRIVDSYEPDIIDINCGCWVKNVVGNGAGAGLLKDLPKMERIVSAVVKATMRPVTVKTRLGWDSESIRIVEVAKMLEQCGVKLLTIHCRTRSQGHKGVPDFSWIPKVKAAVSIPIFINGSLTSPAQIQDAFEETGCDGVMIARGALENPWIFKQAKEFRTSGVDDQTVSLEERFSVMLRHLELSVEHKGERTGVIEFRKHYAGYLRGSPNASRFRAAAMNLLVFDSVRELSLTFLNNLIDVKGAKPSLHSELPSEIGSTS
jgi:tRNA-dihydrouridine synthase B